ncbi:MAG: hypothetical protein B6U72_05135 [Candidatus Altiarchaeales archaeon ex4484_2]|nr:MAG: hypothetical protein B6U72_05135 [Candidatus Altiarchaeales archaeon ex4484_2]
MEYRLLRLPSSLRRELKKPFGRVLGDVRELDAESDIIICVGDRVSVDVLEAGLKPRVIVYDCRIKRESIELPSSIKKHKAKLVEVKNPPGSLTPEAFNALERALDSGLEYKIFVDGEEDLVALAAIKLAPLGSLVVYGQPGEGLVAVEVDGVMKEKVNKIMEQMV